MKDDFNCLPRTGGAVAAEGVGALPFEPAAESGVARGKVETHAYPISNKFVPPDGNFFPGLKDRLQSILSRVLKLLGLRFV